MEDCSFNPPTNGKKGFHYVIKNGRPHLLTRKDLKDTPKDNIAFKLPSKEGSRKLRMKAQSELIDGLSSGVLPMSWELRPSGNRVPLQWETLRTSRTSRGEFTGYTAEGFDIRGIDRDGRDIGRGVLVLAHDENGFDAYGIHRESRGLWVKRFGQISSRHSGPI